MTEESSFAGRDPVVLTKETCQKNERMSKYWDRRTNKYKVKEETLENPKVVQTASQGKDVLKSIVYADEVTGWRLINVIPIEVKVDKFGSVSLILEPNLVENKILVVLGDRKVMVSKKSESTVIEPHAVGGQLLHIADQLVGKEVTELDRAIPSETDDYKIEVVDEKETSDEYIGDLMKAALANQT